MDRGEFVSRLQSIRKQIERVRAEARLADKGEALAGIHRELDTLSALVNGQMQELKEAGSASELLDRLKPIEHEMEILTREWTDFRNAVALAAAKEITDEADAYAGWRKRWGAHFELAWERRKHLLGLAEEMPPQQSAAFPKQKPGSGNIGLLLELRYSAGLPMTEVARYLGISPAGVQMRIADFELSMTAEIVRQAMTRQLPPGWRVYRPMPGVADPRSRLLLRRGSEQPGSYSIVVDVLAASEDRDVGSGRPRGTGRPPTGAERERGPRIWGVVFWDDPEVRFIPGYDIPAVQDEPMEAFQARVIELAGEQRYSVLTDAIKRVSGA